ncbi:MAG: autotransporter-associated N-terminal domain-containing protein [Fusobacterium necrophorum]|nr:autotransporter-associated N-terminal domain-containing protein [Fusobacterium necrophorum]
MKNPLYQMEKHLRAMAKRYKSIPFSIGVAIVFLMLGMKAFAEEMVTEQAVLMTRPEIGQSLESMTGSFERLRAENNKLLSGAKLELIQLMEQGDQVVKSPWSSWQFGMNYLYNNWSVSYNGRGDKKEKYPYAGIFTRSNDLFVRNISPDSLRYGEIPKSTDPYAATSSAREGLRSDYGIASTTVAQEPVLSIELGASVKPKEVVKNPISITSPTIVINPPTILNIPGEPTPPTPPVVAITPFNPVAPDPVQVSLPNPPTFNIKLGSFCNSMTGCGNGTNGGAYVPNIGTPNSFTNSSSNQTLTVANTNSPSLRHSWNSTGNTLLKVFFDYTGGTGGGIATFQQDVTIDSINPLTQSQKDKEAADGRPYNGQAFLVGGSRVATLDNLINGRVKNGGIVKLKGPLVVGFEIQTDTIYASTTQGVREVSNIGTITDIVEETDDLIGGYKKGKIKKSGEEIEASTSGTLNLSTKLGGGSIPITRTPDVVDNMGYVITPGGYMGYKIGLILTTEDNDTRSLSDYRLINDNGGNINFNGKSSIGIQIYAPGSDKTHITVQNNGTINMGGIESYGLKLSSRVSEEKMTFSNAGGTINIKGNNGSGNSLSSGIAVLEDSSLTNTSAIRAYKDKVKNEGTIEVSGGQGNTGMVMILKSDDNITNDTSGTISVSGTKNIGMRVDLGSFATDDTAPLTPEAINKGSINITGGSENIGMVAQKSENSHQAVASNDKNIKLSNVTKGIGMFSQLGAEIVNTNNAKIEGNAGLNGVVGMVINDAASSGGNQGTISLSGTKVTGVYNIGKFTMTSGKLLTSGEKSITLYAKNPSSNTEITGGTMRAENKALGLFADKAIIKLGGTTKLEADGDGTLLFYNYTSGSNNAEGKFALQGLITGKLTNKATAFYFKDTTPGTTSGQTADKLNTMFTGSGSNQIELTLDENSTLFVLDNTSPNTSAIGLSTVDISQINNFLGSNVKIDTINSSPNFKAYKATKASLSIDSDVNLDNHTGATIDKYYRVDFLNSNVTVESGKKMTGTDASSQNIAIAQANFDGAADNTTVKVENKGTIDFSKKKGTAIVVDFGTGINSGSIKMDAINGAGENSIALFGASNSKLENSGDIELGTNGVGIWGTNKITSSLPAWEKHINITNSGNIKGINGKSGLFGIYAPNDTVAYPGATSIINHSGNIDFSQVTGSSGILMKNGRLNSSGDISVKEGSVGVNATASEINVTAGTYTIGKGSAGFKIAGLNSKFLGTGGSIAIIDKDSATYVLEGVNLTSGTNFKDDLTLTSTNPYTYINATNSTLNYENTKAVANDETIFMNANHSTVNLKSATNISSTNKKVVGVYATNGGAVSNAGTISLTGDGSSALYGAKTASSTSITNEPNGKIEIGKNGSGIYVVENTGVNKGNIKVGENSLAMRTEGGTLENQTGATIESSSSKAVGMSQKAGGNIENAGTISLTGDQSIGMHSENVTIAGHIMKNSGSITIGDSSNPANPSLGIFSANGINSTIVNDGKVVAGKQSIGIYGGNVNSGAISEISAGEGGIGIYSKEGEVTIENGVKLSIGASLGKNKEGVAVYLAGDHQTLNSKTSDMTIGDGSFGYVMTGQGNTVTTGYAGNTGNVSLGKDTIFLYSADQAGNIENYNHLVSAGDENYGLYVSGPTKNYGNIDFANGIGNVGIYSYLKGASSTPGVVKNYGDINVSASDITDPDNKRYGIGMAAGYAEEDPPHSGIKVIRGLGNIENHGTIRVTTPDSIGMYATGTGSKAINYGNIEVSAPKKNIGMFIEEGATGENYGHIYTVGSGNKGQIGVAVMKGSRFINHSGATVNVNADKGYGLFYVNGAIIENYGSINITKKIEAADMSKEMGDVKIHAPAGAPEATIITNGIVKTPTIVDVQAIPNRVPNDIPMSSIGMYINTSGINYTKPITNLGALPGLTEADLIIGTEATKYTNSKYIQLSQEMIEPYNEVIRKSGIEKWSIYSGSLNWMASITQLPDYTIRSAYLVKAPYTVWAGNQATPVDKKDTYNFLDGLEQRYGVEALGSRENQLFQKLNGIGNNERILFFQATDEMMGHQYANVQQRIQATGKILDQELKYLKKEWDTKSKDSNKIKAFGMRGEYNTDTAGIIDYTNHAQGFAYLHESETVQLGNTTGWYTGLVHNELKFKDIGKSKEEMLQAKLGIFKSRAYDHNNSLNWTTSGEIFIGRNKMHRRYLVVDDIFQAKSRYWTYGVAFNNELSKTFRTSESTFVKPYGELKLEYGRFQKIKEKNGEVRLEVKANDYYSVKPEIGVEAGYKHYLTSRGALTARVGVSYSNELGEVAKGKNKARVAYTNADWFNIRGEKEDRRGNLSTDLHLGLDNEAYGVTANIGYDTKGQNVRGGLGLRVIF